MSSAKMNLSLLKASWLNLRNAQDILEHSLRQNQDGSEHLTDQLKEETANMDAVIKELETALTVASIDYDEINAVLLRLGAPHVVETSIRIADKTDWILGHFQAEIGRLRAVIGDLEDKLTALKHENLEVHQEFKQYTVSTAGKGNAELTKYKEKCQILEDKLGKMEDEYCFLNSTIQMKDEEIERIKTGVDARKQESPIPGNKSKLIFDTQTTITTNEKSDRDTVPTVVEEENTGRRQVVLLLQKLARVQQRYSQKRERHRQQLQMARVRLQQRAEEEAEHAKEVGDLNERLRATQLRLKSVTFEKNKLSARMTPLQREVDHLSASLIAGEEQINSLQRHIRSLTADITGSASAEEDSARQ